MKLSLFSDGFSSSIIFFYFSQDLAMNLDVFQEIEENEAFLDHQGTQV